MHQDKTGAELNLALRDNLTLVNKGFVQALCLQFHNSKQRAQLAYADNLAETRRLMQLLCEMRRLNIPPDPDGPSENSDRGGPDLQSTAREIWLSDLALATRRLEALRKGQASLASSRTGGSGSSGLEPLIEEAKEFAGDLQDRSNGIERLDRLGHTTVKSEAERTTLEDFLVHLDDAEESFLAGKTDATLPETDPFIVVLNTVLGNHFLAIDQFFLHGFLLHKWKEETLAEASIKHSVDEMRGAFQIAQRILHLGCLPSSVFSQDVRLPYHVSVGSSPLEALRNDLKLTENLVVMLQRAKELAEHAPETRSIDMLSIFIDVENDAKKQLAAQLEKLSKGETPGGRSGKFNAMLDRWAAA